LGTTDKDDVHKIMSDRKKVTGVAIEERQVRRYPQGTMLSHVIGYTSFNHESGNPYGARGIELQYEKYLKGKSGQIQGMRDARGREIRERRVVDVDPTPGANL
jgi:stage V sporulation protein D (sporulation-specific penicillin-binding protein)